jgi:hypothetical protein
MQEVDYLSQIWNRYKEFKKIFIDFNKYILREPRSDIIKELTYSRQNMNTCSQTTNSYGGETKIFDCTRVKDELINPIATSKLTKEQLSTLVHSNQIDLNGQTSIEGYCYGNDLGRAVIPSQDLDLTDNWFCCQEWTNDPTSSGNPTDYMDYVGI